MLSPIKFISNFLFESALTYATIAHRQEEARVGFAIGNDQIKDFPKVQRAYALAKSFDGVHCPWCWVEVNGKVSFLICESALDKLDYCKCQNCGFRRPLSKGAH